MPIDGREKPERGSSIAFALSPLSLEILDGDIAAETTDAIVNAANSSLLGGGGVDGAIHRRGGPAILAECRELRRGRYEEGLATGQAVATTAGELAARWVGVGVESVLLEGGVSRAMVYFFSV